MPIINEKDSENEMKKIGVDDRGIDYMIDKTRFRLVKVHDVKCVFANILKQEMLSIGGDAAVNKGCVNCSVEKSDVLVVGTVTQFRRVLEKLNYQPGNWDDIKDELKKAIK